jgi:hypothetical protein
MSGGDERFLGGSRMHQHRINIARLSQPEGLTRADNQKRDIDAEILLDFRQKDVREA